MKPATLTKVPTHKQMIRRETVRVANSMAKTEGTIRYENIRRTPTIATDDIATNPKDM